MSIVRRSLGIAGLAAVAAGVWSCASYRQVAVTTDPAVVASCQKIDDLSLPPDRSYDDESKSLLELARAKGANYLLVESNDTHVRKGVAYSCSMPPTGTR
jgi:hypothetical protein